MLKFEAEVVRARVDASPEFRLAARAWDCAIVLDFGGSALRLAMRDGRVVEAHDSAGDAPADLRISAPEAEWRELLRELPKPGCQALPPTDRFGRSGFRIEADRERTYYPYYGAVRCIVDVLRELQSGPSPRQSVPDVARRFDDAVGRYAYIRVDGIQYRVYFEETGQGIPLLLPHTAGADARQWRHLLEDAGIQRHYRMIAYDLPYHAK